MEDQYRRFGMAVPHPGLEPADHLGLELSFVAHLCGLGLAALEREQPEALARVTDALRDFVEGHLGRWAGDCLQRVDENADTGFYSGAALIARGCLAETARILASWRA